jgi:hypothetical protein
MRRTGRLPADGKPGDARLQAAIVGVFQGSLRIATVPGPGGERWMALPDR